MLPWKFLFHLGVMEHPSGGLHIPYHLQDGSLASRHRIRTALSAKEGSHWSKGTGAIVPYGLERLEEARNMKYLVLVEGESARHPGQLCGRTTGNEMVNFGGPPSLTGQMVTVKITAARGHTLVGEHAQSGHRLAVIA